MSHPYRGQDIPDSGFYCLPMNSSRLVRFFKKFHKWPGILIAFLAILYALSGIVLNHREFFSSFDISRKWMPPGFQYSNWNMSAVKGAEQIGADSLLVFGNIGVWLTDAQMTRFQDFNKGFPRGIDKRKVYALKQFGDKVVAATHFGLYQTDSGSPHWERVPLPLKEQRLTDLALKGDSLMVLSRGFILATSNLKDFSVIQLPPPDGYIKQASMFQTLWELHSGELFGLAGRLFVDALGLVLIWLSVSGVVHFFLPGFIRRRKKSGADNQKLISAKRLNLRWHNLLGYLFAGFLIVNTTAGIFLRPPLLIPIATKKVGIIPYTHLDSPNPWNDKLRRVVWDESLGSFIFSTSDGFFAVNEALDMPPIPLPYQPPVSVMGLNIFEPMGQATYLVGSFTGMYVWNLGSNRIFDFVSGQPLGGVPASGRPIGTHMAAGWIMNQSGHAWWFDYNHGAVALEATPDFPAMGAEIVKKSPISWWNAALEVHTGRIFEHLLGPLYILIVPLAGLSMIIVLVSGFLMWWLGFRKIKVKGYKSPST